jgi:hypothetical protein
MCTCIKRGYYHTQQTTKQSRNDKNNNNNVRFQVFTVASMKMTLTMEAVRTSGMSVYSETTWHYIRVAVNLVRRITCLTNECMWWLPNLIS